MRLPLVLALCAWAAAPTASAAVATLGAAPESPGSDSDAGAGGGDFFSRQKQKLAREEEKLATRLKAATSKKDIDGAFRKSRRKAFYPDNPNADEDPAAGMPTLDDAKAFTKDVNYRPGSAWSKIGAPHGKASWKNPVDYLIDPKPMKAVGLEHVTLVPRVDREDGVEVHVYNPGWPLNAQQLRMVAVAVHQVASDHPEIPMDKNTRCFCRVVAPLPRCACAHGTFKAPPMKQAAALDLKLRDIEENAARALSIAHEEARHKHRYEPRPTVYTPRVIQHREAAVGLRQSRVAGEWEKHVDDFVKQIVDPDIEDPSHVLVGETSIGEFVCVESHRCFSSTSNVGGGSDVWEAVAPVEHKGEDKDAADAQAGVGAELARVMADDDAARENGLAVEEARIAQQYYSAPGNASWYGKRKNPEQVPNLDDESAWCLGVAKIVSISPAGNNPSCCVHYKSVHEQHIGDRYDYHLPIREANDVPTKSVSFEKARDPTYPSTSSARARGAVVDTECGVPVSLLTLNCSDARVVRAQEARSVQNAHTQRELARVRSQQAGLLSVDMTQQLLQVLKLLREETIARAHEYARFERETAEKNALTHRRVLAEQKAAVVVARKEVMGNETEGLWNVSQAFNESFHIVQEHDKDLKRALKAQKKVADARVAQWDRIVNKVRLQLEAEKSTPVSVIESKVPSIVNQKASNAKIEAELSKQEGLLAAQQEGGIELLTAQEREDVRERNETNQLQRELDASYEKTRAAVESDRNRRLKAEAENKRRRALDPLPRPQPVRPIPQCGPTPGWLLSPQEQDDEILRCIAPSKKGGESTRSAYLFLASVFGGGDHNAGVTDAEVVKSMGAKSGVSSTIAAGCRRVGRNVSYFSVLRKIKMRQDQEEDARNRANPSGRGGIIAAVESTNMQALPSKNHADAQKRDDVRDKDLMASKSNPFLEVSEGTAPNNSSRDNNNNSIAEANAVLQLPLNSTRQNYGPSDELGKFAQIPKGAENARMMREAISCLCDAPEVVPSDQAALSHSYGRGGAGLKRDRGVCLDSLDQENNMISLQWRDVVRNRIRRLQDEVVKTRTEAEARQLKDRDEKVTPPGVDVAGMVKRIETQRVSLKRATETLNDELSRRWQRGPTLHGNPAYMVEPQSDSEAKKGPIESSVHMIPKSIRSSDGMRFKNTQQSTSASPLRTDRVPDAASAGFAPVSDGSCGATLYKAWEQVKILEEETDKLRADLRECRAKPDQYQPGCDEDLSFQVTRLRQESERRQALIQEETIHLERKLTEAKDELKKTCDSAQGCDPSVEQGLRLRVKQVQECVDIRVRHDHEVSWRLIYACLWKYRDVKIAHQVEEWFTVPQIDMSNGCKKLHPLAMAGSQKNLVELDQCLCEEWNDVTKLESKAAHEEAKASAAEKLSKAQEDFREKQDEERAKERQDAEEKVSVLLWRCFLSSPDPSSFFRLF